MSVDIVTLEDCATNYANYQVEGSSGHIYSVTLNGSEQMPFCDCKGFHYRRECKHVNEVMEKACLGNAQWRDPKENPEIKPIDYNYDAFSGNKCICGAPMVYVRRAV